MTIAKLRELVAAVPIRPNQFRAVDRVAELLARWDDDVEAPRLLWDDHGMVICQDGETVQVFCGGRVEGGWWIARRSELELMEARAIEAAAKAATTTTEQAAD